MKLIDISTPKYPNTFCKVDDEDFEWLNQWTWYPLKRPHTIYVCGGTTLKSQKYKRNKPYCKAVRIHRLITNAPNGMEVDHINGNGLDNRRENLRVCTKSENNMNRGKRSGTSSKYKGVTRKYNGKFVAEICPKKSDWMYLGIFANEDDAAKAYNMAAIKFFGEYAKLNPIPVDGES